MSSESIERFKLVSCRFCDKPPETGITGAPECDNWRYVKCSNDYCPLRHVLFTVDSWGGEWKGCVSLLHHERILKELEARLDRLGMASKEWAETIDRIAAWSDWEGSKHPLAEHVNNLVCELKQLRAQPSLSDAIKEVEKMRDEWNSIPTKGHDVHTDGYHYGQTCKNAANQIIERLKSLGTQEGEGSR